MNFNSKAQKKTYFKPIDVIGAWSSDTLEEVMELVGPDVGKLATALNGALNVFVDDVMELKTEDRCYVDVSSDPEFRDIVKEVIIPSTVPSFHALAESVAKAAQEIGGEDLARKVTEGFKAACEKAKKYDINDPAVEDLRSVFERKNPFKVVDISRPDKSEP
ncbi:MAG: hypothetical protein GC185_06625 [Alphaproteobacteria bacterium]|nr:hypothetical protein [Alphaproteobacteria bacterium]